MAPVDRVLGIYNNHERKRKHTDKAASGLLYVCNGSVNTNCKKMKVKGKINSISNSNSNMQERKMIAEKNEIARHDLKAVCGD